MSVTVIYFFLPETRQRSLEDMDAIFLSAKNPFDVVKVARTMPSVTLETMEVLEKGQKAQHADELEKETV